MKIEPVEIKLELINEKVKFLGVSSTNQDYPITMDYLPPLGDGQGFLGLELLVMSFAGCVSTAVVALLRKTGKTVEGYKMSLKGYKRESPLSLEKIEFEITVTSQDITDENILGVLKTAETISPVWMAIKNNVDVTYQYQILRE